MNVHEISKSSISLVSEFPNEFRNKLIKLVFSSYISTAQDRSKIIDNFSKDTNIPRENVCEVLGVYILLLGIFLHSSENEFSEKLTEIGFLPEFIQNLPFLGNREKIIDNLQQNYNTDFGKSLSWRIDITLSSSELTRKVPNLVVLSLTTRAGKKYIIELNPRMFHKFRFSVALILNELNLLKSSK